MYGHSGAIAGRYSGMMSNIAPPKMLVKLTYTLMAGYGQTLTSTGGGLSPALAFRCNSLRVPNATSGDGSARGFAEWMQIYHRACVVGSKCTATYTYDTGSATQFSMVCYNKMSLQYLAPNTVDDVIADRYCKVKYLTQNRDVCIVVNKWSYKVHSVKNPMDDPDMQCTLQADAVIPAYYHIGAFAQNAHTETCFVNVKIDYICVLNNPEQLP